MSTRVRIGVAAGLAVAAVAAAVILTGSPPARDPHGSDRTAAVSPGVAPARGPGSLIRIGAQPSARAIPRGFLGFSFEYQAVRAYTGGDARAINPVLVALLRNLSPGQAPVIRIGGDSSDVSWVPTRGIHPPPFVSYPLTASWLATTSALAHTLGARVTMGLNLAANEPALATAEARAFIHALGRRTLTALEIGNEANVYAKIELGHTLLGAPLYARSRSFDYRSFRNEFRAVATALPRYPLAGPALAVGPVPQAGSWNNQMPSFLRSQPRLRVLTIHRYPLRNCYVPPASPQFPSVANLLSDYSSTGLASSLTPWLDVAAGQHRQMRVDELNSVACRGKPGVSDVFASALWAPDALFALVKAGVGGINIHTLPNAAYELFRFRDPAGTWTGDVRPVYYGLQLFAQAAPAGSRLVALSGRATPLLSRWATESPGGTVRVLLINKSTRDDRIVRLRLPGRRPLRVTVERLLAPSVHAGAGVTLGGRSYGVSTATGRLDRPLLGSSPRRGRDYPVRVPHASAALVTFNRG